MPTANGASAFYVCRFCGHPIAPSGDPPQPLTRYLLPDWPEEQATDDPQPFHYNCEV